MISATAWKDKAAVSVSQNESVVAASAKPTSYILNASKADIAGYSREGNDLIINLKNGHTVYIRDFFLHGAEYNDLLLSDGGYSLVDIGDALSTGPGSVDGQLVTYIPVDGHDPALLILLSSIGVLGAAGIAVAVANNDSGSSAPAPAQEPETPKDNPPAADTTTNTTPDTSTTPAGYQGNVAPIQNNQSAAMNNPTPGIRIAPGLTETPKLYVDGKEVPATYDPKTGMLTPNQSLPDGKHDITYTLTDQAGNESDPSTPFVIIVDTTPPVAPTVALQNDTGASATDHITSDGRLKLAGIESGATVEYSIDGGKTWSGSFTAVEGANTVQVRQSDVAGNISAASSLSFTLDTKAPAAPTVALQNDTGASATDHITNDGRLKLSGIEDGAYIEYSVDNGATWLAIRTPGPFSSTVEGVNVIQVRQTDVAGNVSQASSITFTLDTTAPVAPALAVDNGAVKVTGIETAAGTTWQYQVDGGAWVTGSGTAIPASAFTATGSHTVLVKQTDVAGNVSDNGTLTFTLDTTAPPAPTVALQNDTGDSATDHITNDGTLKLTGVETGATVQYSIDGGKTWSGSFTAVEGANTVLVRQTDAAGHVSDPSQPLTFTYDTTLSAAAHGVEILMISPDTGRDILPYIPYGGDFITSAQNLAVWVHPALPSDERVQINLGDGVWHEMVAFPDYLIFLDGSPAVPSGNYLFKYDATLDEGTYTFQARVIDAAGNTVVSPNQEVVIDTTPPGPLGVTLANDTGASATDHITNDGTLALSGVEDGATVVYSTDGGANWHYYDSDGTIWTPGFPPWNPLFAPVEGDNTVLLRQYDVAGNFSAASITFTLDTTPPAAPTLTLANDNGAPGDLITSDGTINVTGIETATGTTWQYSLDNGTTWHVGIGTTILIDPFSVSSGLGGGEYTVLAHQTDVAGNVSENATLTVTIVSPDLVPNVAITSYTDNVGMYTGDFPSGTVTDDTTPTLNGTVASGFVGGVSFVNVYEGTDWTHSAVPPLGTATVNSDGTWHFTLPETAEGSHTYTAMLYSDVTSFASYRSAPFTLTVDTTPPVAPGVTLANDTGTSATDNITKDGTLNLTGIEPDAKVEYSVDGGTTWSGSFTAVEGDNTVLVRQTDVAGNVSENGTLTFTLGTTLPAAATVWSITDDTGASSTDFITSDQTLVFHGTSPLGAPNKLGPLQVEVSIDGTNWHEMVIPQPGDPLYISLPPGGIHWVWDNIANPLPEGNYTIQMRVTDTAGNVVVSPGQKMVIDTTAPVAPALAVDNGAVKVTGIETAAGTTWQYQVDGGAWVDGSGTTIPGSAFTATGSHTVLVKQTDVAGNVSDNGTLTFTLDTTAPPAPTLALLNDTGASNTDLITNDGTITVTGLATAAGTTWQYQIGTGAWVTGTGTTIPASAFASDGSYTVNVHQTDAAGKVSNSGTLSFTLDTTAPAAPSVTLKNDTGISATDHITSDSTLSVSAEAGATVQFSTDGGTTWGANYSVAEGANTVMARATDVAGNISASSSITFTLDTKAPVAPALAVDNGAVKVTGIETAAGTTWQYQVDGGAWVTGSGTTIPGSAFTATGSHTVLVKQTDVAGNVSDNATLTFTLDTTAPPAPTLALLNDTGASNTDLITNDGTITVTGLATAAGTTWQYQIGTGAWVTGTGTTIPASAFTADGSYTVNVHQTDAAGKVSNSGTLSFTLDTTAPPAPSVTLKSDTGISATDHITSDATLSVSAEAGATVQFSTDGGTTWGANYSVAEGANTVMARATDVAGNVSASSSITFTLDTTLPATTVPGAETSVTINPVTGNNTINAADAAGNVLLTGTVSNIPADAASSTLVVTVGGVDYPATLNSGTAAAPVMMQAFAAGPSDTAGLPGAIYTWSLSVPGQALADAANPVIQARLTVTDAAGNSAIVEAAPHTYLVDTIPPVAPTVALAHDTGASATDYITSDGTLNVTGVEAGATVQYSTNGGTTWTSSFTAIAGENAVQVRQVDVAGNVSQASSIMFTLDTTAPEAPAFVLVNSDTVGHWKAIGMAEPGAIVTVTWWDNSTSKVTADENAHWSAESPALPTGSDSLTVSATATDIAGNTTIMPWSNTIVDPSAPLEVWAMGDPDANGRINVIGTGGPNATVTVTWPDNSTSTVVADANGLWSVESPTVQTSGNIAMSSSDGAYGTAWWADSAAPAAPTVALQNDTGASATDHITSDGTLNVTGVETGATVQYSIDGGKTWSGSFTAAEGENTVQIRQVDTVGHASAASSITFTLDTTPPTTTVTITSTDPGPTVYGPVLDNGNSLAWSGLTVTATLSGTGLQSGEKLMYSHDGGANWIDITNSVSGTNVSYTDDFQFVWGFAITMKVVDTAGNGSAEASASDGITYADALGLGIFAFEDNVVPVTGDFPSGSATNDTSPLLKGDYHIFLSMDPNIAIRIYDENHQLLGEAEVTGGLMGGTWTYQLSNLTEGTHSYTAVIVDAAGNEVASSTGGYPDTPDNPGRFSIIVDTTPPDAPMLALANDTGASATDHITNDGTLNVTGIESGATVQYSTDNGATWSDSFTAVEGANTVQVRQTDVAGNASDPTTLSFTLDTTPPIAPSVALANDTGTSSSDNLTSDGTLNVTGLESNATWEYQIDGGAWAPGSGTTISVTAEGEHTVNVRQTDVAGNLSPESTLSFTLDATSPTQTVIITNYTDNTLPNVGTYAFDVPTNDTRPVINGTISGPLGEGESLVVYYRNDNGVAVRLGTATVHADNSWSYAETSDLEDGSRIYMAHVLDATGNFSPRPWEVVELTVDTVAPSAPTVALANDTGASATDHITSDGTLNVTGVESGAKVEYSTDGGTTWSSSFTAVEGANTVQVRQTDAAGNVSDASSITFTLDTTPPTTTVTITSTDPGPTVYGPVLDNGNSLAWSGLTVTATLSGTGLQSGERLMYSHDGGANWIDITNSVSGTNVSYTDDFQFVWGFAITMKVVDTAGNGSAEASASDGITYADALGLGIFAFEDNVVPVTGDFPSGSATNDTSPLLKGDYHIFLSMDPNIAIRIYDENHQLLGEAEVTGGLMGGTWTYQLSNLTEGTHSYTAVIVDAAGNEVASSTGGYPDTPDNPGRFSIIVDTTPPDAPMLALANDTGASATDHITSDGTLNVSGIETGATVQYSTDGGTTWSGSFTAAEGDNTVLVRQTDVAGNVSENATLTFTLDTTPPTQTAPIVSYTADSGSPDGGPYPTGTFGFNTPTIDETPTLNGTVSGFETGDFIRIYEVTHFANPRTILLGTATVDAATGTWNFTVPFASQGDVHTYYAVIVDAAGNEGPLPPAPGMPGLEQLVSLTVDLPGTPAPPYPEITGYLDDQEPVTGVFGSGTYTNDTTPQIQGTISYALGANEYVVIYRSDDGGPAVKLGNAMVTGTTWTYDDSNLTDQTYVYTAQIEDAAGNQGNTSAPFTLTVEIPVPGPDLLITAVIDDVAPQTGPVEDNGWTNDTTPQIHGTVDGRSLTANEFVSIYRANDGGLPEKIGTATITGTAWTYNDSGLADGHSYVYSVRIEDAAGNQGPFTNSYTINVDTTPPAAPTVALANDTGVSNTDLITSDGTVNVTGIEPNATWQYSLDNGMTWNTGTGTSISSSAFVEGANTVLVQQTDQASNISDNATFSFTLLTTPPVTIAITSIEDDTFIPNDFLTADQTLLFHGTVSRPLTADERVEVSLDGTTWHVATVTTTGGITSWTWDNTANTLVGGNYTIQAKVVDQADNIGATAEQALVIDMLAPSPVNIAITSIENDTGSSATDFVTDDPTLIFRGTVSRPLTADERVQISLDGTTWHDAVVTTAAGITTWTWDNTANTLDGVNYIIHAKVVDQAGNIFATAEQALWVAAPPPPTATIENYTDDVGIFTGHFSNGTTTDDTTPTLNGTVSGLKTGDSIWIYEETNPLGTATVDVAQGTWSFTVPETTEGVHTYHAVVTSAGGYQGLASAPFTLTVDTTPPGPLTNLDLVDNYIGSDPANPTYTGTITPGMVTDDQKPTYSGNADADTATVVVYDNGNLLGSTVVKPDGSWSYEPELPLGFGPHSFTAHGVDAVGNEGPMTTPEWNFTVTDHGPPPAPMITQIMDNYGTVTGPLAKNQVTDDTTPTVSGTAGAGLTVMLYVDGTPVGSTTADGNGNWSVTSSALSGDGLKNITAVAIDGAGQRTPETGAYPIVLDTTAPGKPAFTATDDVGPVTGPITATTNNRTDDTHPTFSGTGEAGSTITIYDGRTVVLGTATVDKTTGTWSFTPTSPLTDGPHSVTVTETDLAGNKSVPSDVLNFTVVMPPHEPVSISKAVDDYGMYTGDVAKGGATDDTTPTLWGMTTPGTVVTISDGLTVLGSTTADTTGVWNFTTPVQNEGTHTYTATAQNAAGTMTTSPPFTLTIDKTPPAVPVIDQVIDDVGLIQGPLANGARTDDTTPTLVGHLPNGVIGDTIKIYDNGALLGSTAVNSDGTWNYTPLSTLSEGPHVLTASSVDAVGNESPQTAAWNIVVDLTAPTATATISAIHDDTGKVGDFITSDQTLLVDATVSGTLDAGDKVQITLGDRDAQNQLIWHDATLNGATWQYDTTGTPLAGGTYTFQARVIDAAGNIGDAKSQDVIIVAPIYPPQLITITAYYDDVTPWTGDFANGTSTNDTTPLLKGTVAGLAPTDVIKVYEGTNFLGDATIAGGAWSLQLTNVSEGPHTYTARIYDAAGNTGMASDPFTLTVDTTPPGALTNLDLVDNYIGTDPTNPTYTGTITQGMLTDDQKPTYSGNADADTATVVIYDNGNMLGSVAVMNGSWSYEPAIPLGGGGAQFPGAGC